MHKTLNKILFLFAGSAIFAVSTMAAPIIKVDSADFDMGSIKDGEMKSMKHTFIVTNTGTDTLKIEKVKPG
jgi:hypothetical protein